jgi:hypothetical protein
MVCGGALEARIEIKSGRRSTNVSPIFCAHLARRTSPLNIHRADVRATHHRLLLRNESRASWRALSQLIAQ